MKTLSALFLGMGMGYMNMGELLFIIPMSIGLIFFIIDEIDKHRTGDKK